MNRAATAPEPRPLIRVRSRDKKPNDFNKGEVTGTAIIRLLPKKDGPIRGGRPRKPPRLNLRNQGKTKIWEIRDGERRMSTGYVEDQIELAELYLAQYISRKTRAIKPDQRRRDYVKTQKSDDTVVYFATSRVRDGYPVKIGRTAERILNHRLCALQTGNPDKLEIVACVRSLPDDETRLLRMVRPDCASRDWATITQSSAKAMLSLIESRPHVVAQDWWINLLKDAARVA